MPCCYVIELYNMRWDDEIRFDVHNVGEFLTVQSNMQDNLGATY